MNREIVGILLVSLILTVISFVLSLLANVLLDAIIRSLIVFVGSFVILLGAVKLIEVIAVSAKKNVPKEAGFLASEQNNDDEQDFSREDKQLDEGVKGAHIDLQTPDEDQFQPFRPQEFNKQDH